MIKTEVGKVKIPEPPYKEGYVKELYTAVRELQRAMEFDLSNICSDNFSEYGKEELKNLKGAAEE